MAFSYACLTLQRVVIPVVLALSALFRPVGISFVYLLMFFISPFIPVATSRNFKGSVTAYLIILIALSTILLLCHIVLQIIIVSLQMDDTTFASCGFTVQLLRHVGFIDFRNLQVLAIIEWLAPEVVVFATSLATYLITKSITTVKQPTTLEDGLNEANLNNAELPTPANPEHTASIVNEVVESMVVEASTPAAASRHAKIITPPKQRSTTDLHPNFDGLIKISPLFCLATLFFAAVLRPSVPGGFYFLIFLLSGSYWATFQALKRGFALLLRFVMVILVIHIICIVAYQTPWMQNYASSDLLVSRLIGLEPLVTSTCDIDIRIIIYNSVYKLDSFLSPIVLLFSFYALALTTKNLIKPRTITKPNTAFGQQLENGSNKFNRQLSMITHASRGSKKESWTKSQRLNVSIRREPRSNVNIEPTETTPLVRHNTRKQRTVSTSESIAGTSGGDIALNSLEERQDDDSGIFDQVSYGIVSVGGFIYQNSYIFTNILMMAWSIVYHSWLTFVLLLWANVLWMIPNQRKAMMRSSPFIVIYAELLLLAQYIYGMNLYDSELPASVDTTGVNLRQIGLERPQDWGVQPCVPLLIKTSFLLMFWVTLRQFFKENSDNRRLSEQSETAPRFSLARVSSLSTPRHEKKTSKFLKKFGDIIKNLLVRLWIWLLVLVIFLCAITGKNMTGFRITYMALFLFFLLVFQSSSKAWIKIMYGFWLFLIFEAMTILILIYTYQFDKFDIYWNNYLNVSDTLQTDIGLERYKTKDLFLHLVSPTIIVILTVIQVHYFHKRLIASLQRPTLVKSSPQSTPQLRRKKTDKPEKTDRGSNGSDVNPRISDPDVQNVPDFDTIKELVRVFLKKVLTRTKRFLKDSKDIAWQLMELHLIKLVYITAFVCCINQICLLHVAFIAVCLLGVISNTSLQIFLSRIMSIIVSVIILSKMMYQVKYLDHSDYDVECTNGNFTRKSNNAAWFGLDKASDEYGGLMGLLRKYIFYMVIVTMHAVVTLRQTQMRLITGQPTNSPPKVLFPNITRDDAEKNLRGMIKYLCNYGFYKFGFELTLIMLVATITYRQDIVAVVYAFWLLVLLCLQRAKCAKIWFIFQMFIGISIFVQYVVLVNLPPSLCLQYPWDRSPYSESIQLWAMLPGNLDIIAPEIVQHAHAIKLIFDFILLLMINRQKRVFFIESQNIPNYPGGSNKSVVADIANLGQVDFDNPTRDFLSHVRNYLDVFMNAVLCGFYWITLAVVFLAGTNIADFLALGYLVGAFVFLWQGSDFYLRPINVILKRWHWLIIYNVANILIKTCLQLTGCLFMSQLTENCCWLVHILGINCASRSRLITLPPDESPPVSSCPDIASQVVLVWDAVCFAFLLFQLRIFKSHYFCHIINDTKANTILASRGAEIIENLRQKQIEHRQEHEKDVLIKIKRKMEKIRATQQKMLRPVDKPTHFDEYAEQAAEDVVRVAPLAHNSSFSSCQGSGYHTPDDDDTTTTSSNSIASVKSTSSSSEQEQLLAQAESEICFDDFASDAQTDYADVRSLSDADESMNAAAAISAATPPPIIKRRLPPSPMLLSPADANIQLMVQPNTPSSELLTIPLEGFLDINRLSMSSAPNSDLAPTLPNDNDDDDNDVEVFSPPPYEFHSPPMHSLLPPTNAPPTTSSLNVNVSGGSSVISSSLAAANGVGQRCRRQSSLNAAAVSWSETVSVKRTPMNFNEDANVSEDVPVTLRQKSLHRRHLSMGNASYSMDETSTLPTGRRRYSNISGARDESYFNSATRPNSWGPVGNAYYMESLLFDTSPATLHGQSYGYPIRDSRPPKRKEIKYHPDAVRAGDYYMFEDMDEKFELDFIEDEVDFLDDKISESEKKMTRRKTIIDVWKDIQNADVRRQLYVRQRSYASAPGSRIGIKIDEELNVEDGGGGAAGVRTSTISEPIGYARRSTSEYFTDLLQKKEAEKQKDLQPSTSKTRDLRSEPGVSGSRKSDESDHDVTDKDDYKEDSDEDIEANPIVRLLEAFLVALTIRLNRFSRNYRYVNKILAEEKKSLKESRGFHRLGRVGAIALFTFMKGVKSDDDSINSTTSSTNALNTNVQNDTNIQTPHENNNPTTTNVSSQPPPQSSSSQSQSQSQQPPHDPQDQVVDIIDTSHDTVDAKSNASKGPAGPDSSGVSLTKGRKSDGMVPEIRVMAPSLDRSLAGSGSMSKQWSYEKVDSTTNFRLEDDFASRDHHILIEVMISTWYAVLSNTDLICYIVVFINQVFNASLISLPLPFMVFLWGTLSLPRPTKTFWVTLIAYTQAIVLIKCIFQFKLIWANYINLPNQPLSAAKIFGVELESHRTIYDLLLLLVLFFHRFILKSQGLWKSEYKEEMVQEAFVLHYDKEKHDGLGSDGDELTDTEDVPEEEQKIAHTGRRPSLISVETRDYNSSIARIEQSSYLSSVRKFFFNMVKKARLPSDVYALMFLCDFVNFFVLLFGFTAFGSQQTDGDVGVQTYLAENKVPIPFLIMLLVQFILIVIDRALYLRKALINKIIFHFFSVIGIHIWMFFIVPMVTERSFYSLAPPIIFYIIKCFYLLFSSYQIKCGYPKRILGNFLTKGFSLVNMISFKFYMLIPFLYELRTILDWVCTDTTMTLFDWLKMEDIFSDIYFIKCSRQMESDFPAIRATKKATYIKLMMGGTMILCIVIAIWGPLCLFALGNAVGTSNVPFEVSLKIRIGPYEPIYDLNNRESFFIINETMFDEMKNAFKKDKNAITFLSSYDATDIAAIRLPGNAPSMWGITPPDKDRLLNDLRSDVDLVARFTYSLTRNSASKGGPITSVAENMFTIHKDFAGRQAMIGLLDGSSTDQDFEIPWLLPKFLKVPNTGEMIVASALMPKDESNRPVIFKMHSGAPNQIWWELKESCTDSLYVNILSKLPYANCESGLVMYTFNDKKFPPTFSFLTAGGIIGLYSTFVLIASRLLKSFISGQNRKIMFEDLPYVDRVLQLCLDIYLVREALEFALEEDLFAKLIFLYRSPETMIKWTRPKEDTNEDETDTESVRSRQSVRRPEQQQQQQQQQ